MGGVLVHSLIHSAIIFQLPTNFLKLNRPRDMKLSIYCSKCRTFITFEISNIFYFLQSSRKLLKEHFLNFFLRKFFKASPMIGFEFSILQVFQCSIKASNKCKHSILVQPANCVRIKLK